MAFIECIPFIFPGIEHVRCLFTTRIARDGSNLPSDANLALTSTDSPQQAKANRRDLQARFGIQRWREVRQVHGTDIVFAAEQNEEAGHPPPLADALATQEAGAGLMVKVADCQPVLVAHASGRFIGAFHVGWRGNRSGAILQWIDAFCRAYRILPSDVSAVRGPSLGPGKSEFVNFEEEWGPGFAAYLDPAAQTVDLWRLTRDQLLAAGLDPARIFSLDLCTYSLSETFFSHRRSRDQGRQAGIIWRHKG
jgi:hypothetical protein